MANFELLSICQLLQQIIMDNYFPVFICEYEHLHRSFLVTSLGVMSSKLDSKIIVSEFDSLCVPYF